MPKLILLFLGLSFVACLNRSAVAADTITESPAASRPYAIEVVTLKDQLEKGLKARRPVEFAFVATVVGMVKEGQLSTELVLSTFHWARKQRKYRRYIFPYFEAALRKRALDEGTVIP